jgi:hypothetical protein
MGNCKYLPAERPGGHLGRHNGHGVERPHLPCSWLHDRAGTTLGRAFQLCTTHKLNIHGPDILFRHGVESAMHVPHHLLCSQH